MNLIVLLHTGATRSARVGREDKKVSLAPSNDNIEEPPDSRLQLERDLRDTQKSAYSTGTLKNLVCQWHSFIKFYFKYNIKEWPISEHTLCLYAQYLAYTFHSLKAVRNYISGVHTLHVLLKVTPPKSERY